MAVIQFAGFIGEIRALHPSLLPPTACEKSLNQKPGRGDLRPWKSPLTVSTVPAGRQTIYRMGRDVASDTQYWLSWPMIVHAVRGFNAADTAERTYYTGFGTPKWTDTVQALASAPYPVGYRDLGVPAPSGIAALSASGGVSTVMRTVSVAYTYLNDINEESAPSGPSALLTCKLDAVINISGLLSPPSGNHGINRIRVYRTQDSSVGGDFYLLSTLSSSTSSTTDTGQLLGEALPSVTWVMPPADLRNLVGLWNGMMAGITGRAVRFCEAYKPYAWPLQYEIVPAKDSPVALGVFGQNMVVLTDGRPILVNGGTPDAMDEQPVDFLQACASARSVVGMGHGVVWASPDGLCYIGQGGSKLLTEGIMTRDDWQALSPSSMVASIYERRYMAFYTVGSVTKGFVIDPLNPTGMYFLDFGASAVYFDDLQDHLYTLSGGSIQRWDADIPLAVTAKSKLFRFPKPTQSFGCAQVVANNYPTVTPITFKLYADGLLKHTQTVLNGNAFRLPSGYYAETLQLELTTTGQILYAAVANSMQELAGI